MNNKKNSDGVVRVIVASDPHCGSLQGLTPPQWQPGIHKEKEDPKTSRFLKFGKLQGVLWNRCMELLTHLAPYQVILWGGDMIEGKGTRSGGAELLVPDRIEQKNMAVAVCKEFAARSNVLNVKQYGVYGTAYHTGYEEDWELMVAEEAGWEKIGSHEWIDVNGCVFDLKHKIGSSAVPHGRGTAVLREMLWNELWAARKLQPKAQVIIRGHAHYYMGVDTDECAAFICPALQGWGTKFGSRECSGLVHWGLMHFDIDRDGNVVNWDKHIIKLEEQTAKTCKVRL